MRRILVLSIGLGLVVGTGSEMRAADVDASALEGSWTCEAPTVQTTLTFNADGTVISEGLAGSEGIGVPMLVDVRGRWKVEGSELVTSDLNTVVKPKMSSAFLSALGVDNSSVPNYATSHETSPSEVAKLSARELILRIGGDTTTCTRLVVGTGSEMRAADVDASALEGSWTCEAPTVQTTLTFNADGTVISEGLAGSEGIGVPMLVDVRGRWKVEGSELVTSDLNTVVKPKMSSAFLSALGVDNSSVPNYATSHETSPSEVAKLSARELILRIGGDTTTCTR